MKLSIFTTGTNPISRGDLFDEPLACYNDLADEVVYVDGSGDLPDGQHADVCYKWPDEFDWPFIGEQFQRGYEVCTGDWVIHADLDFIFHETTFGDIRQRLERCEAPAMSFLKWQFILPDRYNLKSRLVIAVNKKKYGDRIRFDSGGDLCQPSLDGKYLSPDDVPEIKIPFYNYEKIKKTKEQVSDDVGRMERAYLRHFGHTQYGDGNDALTNWHEAQKGKLLKPQQKILLEEHPIYIREVIKNLKPDQFGYDGWGIEGNSYAQNSSR